MTENGKNMSDAQIKILFDFICAKPVCVEDRPNPYVYGQSWAVGNSYSDAQKQSFREQWAKFAEEHPDVWALMPLRDIEE